MGIGMLLKVKEESMRLWQNPGKRQRRGWQWNHKERFKTPWEDDIKKTSWVPWKRMFRACNGVTIGRAGGGTILALQLVWSPHAAAGVWVLHLLMFSGVLAIGLEAQKRGWGCVLSCERQPKGGATDRTSYYIGKNSALVWVWSVPPDSYSIIPKIRC